MLSLSAGLLDRYPRFSLYNSPYVAHGRGCAVDLYPEPGEKEGVPAPSPVAGEVVAVRSVRAPPKPYAAAQDHLIVVDVDERATPVRWGPGDDPRGRDGEQAADPPDGYRARMLHVDPAVAPGDRVAVGDPLGELLRSGFFAPWVDGHVHLGFRPASADPYRASGSLPLAVDVDVEPVPWDGTGTVVETAETYAVLDAPAHPAPGERFAGVGTGEGAALDGGLPHYDGGGLLGMAGGPPGRGTGPDGHADASEGGDSPVTLAGARVGTATGRDVAWADVTAHVDGDPITGVSLFLARDAGFGAKLVCPGRSFAVGRRVRVDFREAGTTVPG